MFVLPFGCFIFLLLWAHHFTWSSLSCRDAFRGFIILLGLVCLVEMHFADSSFDLVQSILSRCISGRCFCWVFFLLLAVFLLCSFMPSFGGAQEGMQQLEVVCLVIIGWPPFGRRLFMTMKLQLPPGEAHWRWLSFRRHDKGPEYDQDTHVSTDGTRNKIIPISSQNGNTNGPRVYFARAVGDGTSRRRRMRQLYPQTIKSSRSGGMSRVAETASMMPA